MKWEAFDDIKTPAGWTAAAKTVEQNTGRRRPVRPVRAALIAACVCLVLAGTAVAAGKLWGIPVTLFTPSEWENTVIVDTAELRHLTASEYSEPIREAIASLGADSFHTEDIPQPDWAACEEFLGVALLKHPWLNADVSQTGGHTITREPQVTLPYAAGVWSENGSLQSAYAQAILRADGVELVLTASIYGEADTEQPILWDSREGSIETYDMACGLTASILTSDSEGLTIVYFATDTVQYRLAAACGTESAALIHEFLDGFSPDHAG